MSNAFAPIVRARPCPIFGRPVHPGFPPIDYSPILLLKPFGFQITPDTLSSSEISRWPTRHDPRLWIQRPSSERRRDFNPPDSCAAQRTLRPRLTSRPGSTPLPFRHKARSPQVRTHSFTARPPDLRRFPLITRALRLLARSPWSATPSIRFLFIGPQLRSALPPHTRSPSCSCASLRSL